eukprot:COSAG01_NODE_26554_length_710_cov_1.098200_3_plen_52_part_01
MVEIRHPLLGTVRARGSLQQSLHLARTHASTLIREIDSLSSSQIMDARLTAI